MAKNQLKDKQPKSTTKTTPKSKEGKKQNKSPVAPPPESIDDASGSGASGDDDDDDDGVDQEGMERLLKALGDDGLSEFDTAQLASLTGDADDDDEDEGDEDEDENESGEDEEEDVSDEESGSNDDEVEDEEEDEAGEKEKKAKTKKTQDKNLKASTNNGVDEDEDDEDEEEMLALDDLDAHSVDEDAILKRKTVINDELAMERIRDTIKLDSSLSWTETLTVTYPETIEVDHEDDLERELAFYKQALHGAEAARNLAAQHSLPWTRPSDYFAEMVKTDAHMERIRQRLLDEKADMKRGEQRKKEREGKKYGKQIQIEKIKEREKSKKEVEERLKALKRKRKDGMGDAEDGEAFDVAVEDALADRPNKKSRNGSGPSKSGPKMSRNRRDSKFGFGGQGKRSKQNTRESTENFDSGNKRHGGKGGPPGKGKKATKPQRLGKGRRQAARGRS